MLDSKSFRASALAALVSLVALIGVRAEDAKPTDGGKAEEFEAKSFDLKAKENKKITLSFPKGKTFSVTVKSDKETDVNLFIYDADKKEVAKDDSEGPNCDLTFTPKKAGKYTLEVVNKGPGANRSTLKVELGKKKEK